MFLGRGLRGGGGAPSPFWIERRGGWGGGQPPRLWLELGVLLEDSSRNEASIQKRRRRWVTAVRSGLSLRAVARRFHVSVGSVWNWVQRAGTERLDRVDWSSRTRGNPRPKRAAPEMEQAVLGKRIELREHSALGEFGAAAIRTSLQEEGRERLPSIRTIHRILDRHGLITRRRERRSAPPSGWYLPDLRQAGQELDAFDFVEGLALAGGRHFDAFTGLSLWGNLSTCTILPYGATLATSLQAIAQHWLEVGRPCFAQFDNDSIFQGSHGHAGHLGRFVHGCLCLGVTPVFAPPRETGFQGRIEAFNRRWQDAVWRRFRFRSYVQLQRGSDRFITAHRQKHATATEHAVRHAVLPLHRSREPLVQRVVFLRRSDAHARIHLLRRSLRLPPTWPHRLVRCEIDLQNQLLSCFALRRRDPESQPLLHTFPFTVRLTPWYSKPR